MKLIQGQLRNAVEISHHNDAKLLVEKMFSLKETYSTEPVFSPFLPGWWVTIVSLITPKETMG